MQATAKQPGSGHWLLRNVNAVFDDEAHFKRIKAASGLSHPKLEAVTDVSQLHIRNIHDLERIIRTKLDLLFCDICLTHRQVFTAEQLLYTKEGLKEHKTKGDSEGALKDANFKGHPRCQCASRMHSDMAPVIKP